MTDRIRIIKHEAVKDSGSFEVRFADGALFKYFQTVEKNLQPSQQKTIFTIAQFLPRLFPIKKHLVQCGQPTSR